MTFEEWAAQPFGKMLDHALWERRMEGAAFAEAAGVKPSSVSRWRNGKGEPDLDGLLRACAVLPELQSWFNVQIHTQRKLLSA
jgi:transcriptional regulator with XRE-family HTH domain